MLMDKPKILPVGSYYFATLFELMCVSVYVYMCV